MNKRQLLEPKARANFVRAVIRELTLAFLPNGVGWKIIELKNFPAGQALIVYLTTSFVQIQADIYRDGQHWDIWGASSRGKAGALAVSFDVTDLERGLKRHRSGISILYQLLITSPEATKARISEDEAVAEFTGKGV